MDSSGATTTISSSSSVAATTSASSPAIDSTGPTNNNNNNNNNNSLVARTRDNASDPSLHLPLSSLSRARTRSADAVELSTNNNTTEEKQPQTTRSLCYLVTGGAGFLGRALVEALLNRGEINLKVLDLQQTYEDDRIDFLMGDVTKMSHVREACKGVDVVFHVASLTKPLCTYEEFYNVNVKGTENVISACLEAGVSKLIYTSTGSVVFDGSDIVNGDENLPYPPKHLDDYSTTKAIAEKIVISANGRTNSKKQPFLTVALRPHAMFGPRDTHFVAQLIAKAREGDITHYVGDGHNMVDFTYVDNAVHAHLLAAEKMSSPSLPPAGKKYFVTNGEPRSFWVFIGDVLSEMGCVGPTKSISFRVAYWFACVMEFLHVILRPFLNFRPTITRHMVCTMACHHWFSHYQATRDFGYKPIVSLDDGLEATITYFQNAVKRRMARINRDD